MKKYCYKDKSGRKVCPKRFVVRKDSTPFVQDPDTGLILGRDKKK